MNTEEKDQVDTARVEKVAQVDTAQVEKVEQDVGQSTATIAAIDPEDEKRTGIKDIAQNVEAMAAEKSKDENKERKIAKPSFFIKATARQLVELDVLTSKEDGRVVSVSKSGLGIDFEKDFPFMVHTKLVFEFSIPNYEDMSSYRQRSSVFRREAQQMLVDRLQLRNYLMVWHLKKWNLTDDDGKMIELTFDQNGSLSEDSLSIVYAVSPTLMDVVMTVYEKDVLLT